MYYSPVILFFQFAERKYETHYYFLRLSRDAFYANTFVV